MTDDDAVQHPKGMIGDDHHRSGGRDRAQSPRIIFDPQLEPAHRRLPEGLADPRITLIFEIDTLQAGLASQPLDGPDRNAPQRWIIGARIAEPYPIAHPPLLVEAAAERKV